MYYIEKKKKISSRKYTTIKELPEIKDVLSYMTSNGINYVGTPYIFTHINLSDGSIIRQDVQVGDSKMITSPEALRKALTA